MTRGTRTGTVNTHCDPYVSRVEGSPFCACRRSFLQANAPSPPGACRASRFAERELMDARMVLIETKRQQLSSIVKVYQALGGGLLPIFKSETTAISP